MRVFLTAAVLSGAFAAILDQLARRDLLHRHWLLPSMAAFLAWQWLAFMLWPRPAWRRAVLSLLAFVTALGVVCYPEVFACREACCARFGYAAVLAGLVFWHQSWRGDDALWDGPRSQLAALSCGLWGACLLLYHRQYTLWMLDIIFFILAAVLWLGRSRAVFLAAALGIVSLAALRSAGGELLVVLLDLALIFVLLLGGGRWLESRLRARDSAAKAPRSPRRWAAAAGVCAVLAVYAARPAWFMVRPEQRRIRLEALAPIFPVKAPGELSPLAARLRGHVVQLAGTIGERSAYMPEVQGRAHDYVARQFREAGYAPQSLEFSPRRKTDFLRRQPYRNVEARLPGRDDGRGLWVVGAHYDSAPGTPGADDNASGVAVLLETARLMRQRGAGRPVRFVAFDAEEPPAFGTRDMGSLRYADGLKDSGARVRGMVNLEMVGYFNPQPGSQLFPPFLQLFYPDRGDFLGLAGNLRSLGLGREFARAWETAGGPPLLPATLPFVFSALAISDQLNFWYAGVPALMVSDTAFFRNPCYHEYGDTPEKLDYERMAAQAEALARVLSSGL